MPTKMNKPSVLTLLTLMLAAQATEAYVLSMSYDEGIQNAKTIGSRSKLLTILDAKYHKIE